MVRTQVLLTREQFQALKHPANQEGKSVAAVIRLGVDAMLRVRTVTDQKILRENAINATGKLHGGLVDLSIVHDHHLGGNFIEAEQEHAG